MRNKNYLIIVYFMLIFADTVFSQNLKGKFYSDDNSVHPRYLNFDSGYVDFVIDSDGCFRFEQRGNGYYKIVENYMIIKTEEIKNVDSFYEFFPNQTGKSTICVSSITGERIPFASISFIDEGNKFINGTNTDFDGLAPVMSELKIKKIKISSIGYQGITIDYSQGKDYKVYLLEGQTLENRNIVFKINSASDDTVNLTMLSIDFKNKKNLKKALHSLEKREVKTKLDQRIYTK